MPSFCNFQKWGFSRSTKPISGSSTEEQNVCDNLNTVDTNLSEVYVHGKHLTVWGFSKICQDIWLAHFLLKGPHTHLSLGGIRRTQHAPLWRLEGTRTTHFPRLLKLKRKDKNVSCHASMKQSQFIKIQQISQTYWTETITISQSDIPLNMPGIICNTLVNCALAQTLNTVTLPSKHDH